MNAIRIIIAGLFMAGVVSAANIISEAGGATRTILETKDYYRQVTGNSNNGSFTEVMHCRFYRYAEPRQNIPLVAIFISWGGSLDGAEGYTQYEHVMNDPFISMVIMPERNGSNDNTSNWYWGNTYTGNGDFRSVPWTHNAVVDILNDIKAGRLDSVLMGNTIDTNRIYAQGVSIGGTATIQIGAKHPEIFAAVNSNVGWTRYWAPDGGNAFFGDNRGCLVFAGLIGGARASEPVYCLPDTNYKTYGNADQAYLPLSSTAYKAYQYTDLNWYFGKTGDAWNYRDPGFESPFIFHTTGSQDDPENQGDNLVPSLDASRRGFMYNRPNAGHNAGSYFSWHWLRNFRKNQSFLAFTNRSYDDFTIVDGLGTGIGLMNDLTKHGWDPETIIDEANHYYVKLTGTGTADVTLHRLQNFVHNAGTLYDVEINGALLGQVTADEYGLVTIPQVANDASIELFVHGTGVSGREMKQRVLSLVCSPNPFNPAVNIRVCGASAQGMRIAIYDVTGCMVADLTGAIQGNRVMWHASGCRSGVYIVRAVRGSAVETKQVILVK